MSIKYRKRKNKLNIIITDDNKDSLFIMTQLLQRDNHTIETSKNGLELIEKLKLKKYDIVLVDIEMPVMDGITAIKKIRNGDAGKNSENTPVIAMTAHTINRNEYAGYGFSDAISKPVDFNKLFKLIEKYSASSNK